MFDNNSEEIKVFKNFNSRSNTIQIFPIITISRKIFIGFLLIVYNNYTYIKCFFTIPLIIDLFAMSVSCPFKDKINTLTMFYRT